MATLPQTLEPAPVNLTLVPPEPEVITPVVIDQHANLLVGQWDLREGELPKEYVEIAEKFIHPLNQRFTTLLERMCEMETRAFGTPPPYSQERLPEATNPLRFQGSIAIIGLETASLRTHGGAGMQSFRLANNILKILPAHTAYAVMAPRRPTLGTFLVFGQDNTQLKR